MIFALLSSLCNWGWWLVEKLLSLWVSFKSQLPLVPPTYTISVKESFEGNFNATTWTLEDYTDAIQDENLTNHPTHVRENEGYIYDEKTKGVTLTDLGNEKADMKAFFAELEEKLELLRNGIKLDDGMTSPAEVNLLLK